MESGRGHLGHISGKGGTGTTGWLGSTLKPEDLFTIVKMKSNRCNQPFYRRVAKAGRTKYRKTHGSRDGRRQQQPSTQIGGAAFRARVATTLDKKRYPSAAE